jgi:tetratricopeptide (TPR) repeat protein
MKLSFWKMLVLSFWVVGVGLYIGTTLVKSNMLSSAEYQKLISETYDYRFGTEKPFAPSNATTFDGNFMAPEKFISSARCATCHTDTHPQWRESAHANSFREPFYQKNVKDLTGQRGIAFTRHCESCHNPIALFSGVLTDKPQFKKRPFDDDGVSCMVCHSIEKVDGRGIGGYVMGEPALLEKADGTKTLEATDQQILDNVPDHKRAMVKDLIKRPEFCAACHKSQVPKELNDYKFMRAFAVGDELQMSSFSKESPHPFYVRNKETCNTCHMKQEPTKYFDVSASKKGTVASHRWAAANTAIPAFYGYKDQLAEVEKSLKDDKMGIDIFAIHQQKRGTRKTDLIAPVNRETFSIGEGDTLTADVVVTNKNIGHSFPPELRDFYEAYVEFTVANNAGKTLHKSGFIKKDGHLDDRAHAYKTYLVKADGSLNDVHEIWRTRVVANNISIQSGRSDLARYKFTIPAGVGGDIKLTAKLQYRRFTRVFSDYSLKKSVDLPIVTMATSERILSTTMENKPQPVDPKAMPDWRRWNNYGISLMDQRQFPQAAEAFDRVVNENVKDYAAFAVTNKALALMEMNGWQEAEKLVNRAIEIDAMNIRAIYQRGRINRVKSRLDKAEEDFKKVIESFPRDRFTLQQLGELAKIKSDSLPPKERIGQLEIAKNYYLKVLEIDPEDISAHYNLIVIYQKLGQKEESKKEAAIFRDLKEDPAVTSLSSNFLQKYGNIANESLPYHSHDMMPFDQNKEKSNYLSAFGLFTK